ncbi:MAG: bifunctional riboflavin kinase/FAD synthetase, partial [Hyphomicrobiales bacterium]|nr:bifunctional riboflavin kinase/FAD synthetase [Hyphomicrobiales bacterium]
MSFLVVSDPLVPPSGLEGAYAAIGNFDGVHPGHRAVIARAVALAHAAGRPAVALTFEPHPADHFAGRARVFRLTDPDQKLDALAAAGLDGAIVLTFDAALAALDADSFEREVLVGRLGLSGVVVGADFHYGRGRTGDAAHLKAAGARLGFSVEVLAKASLDDLPEGASS